MGRVRGVATLYARIHAKVDVTRRVRFRAKVGVRAPADKYICSIIVGLLMYMK